MFCDLDGVRIYYEIHGEGTPILMIHGFQPDHRLMKGCMEPVFSGKPGWKRVYFDLPGMGMTQKQTWIDCSDRVLEVVLSFVDRMLPSQNFLVAGESYGGYLARGLVQKRPESLDGLLLICPVILPAQEDRSLPPGKVIVEDRQLISELQAADANEFTSVAVIQNRKNWERFRDEVLVGLRAADMTYLEKLQNKGYGFSFPVDALSESYNKPVLVVAGRQDSTVGYKDAWSIIETYPRPTLAILDSAGHNLQIEQDELFNALVSEWLDRVQRELP
jgi:pimeloyl-ACP methyl ester carboxylesterase